MAGMCSMSIGQLNLHLSLWVEQPTVRVCIVIIRLECVAYLTLFLIAGKPSSVVIGEDGCIHVADESPTITIYQI